MNIIAFAEICKCLTAKTYITTLSESFTRDPDEQRELYYTGWLAVEDNPGDYTIEAYCEIAYKAMLKKYMIYYMPMPKPESDGYVRDTHDVGIRRVNKKIKFYRRK